MRKLAKTSTALLLGGVATTAMAAGASTVGDARLYWRVSFDETAKRLGAMQFGALVDYDRRFNTNLPPVPIAQVDFDRHGLMNAYMNGLPFARRMTLAQTEGEGEAGGGTSYTAVDYGLLAIGAVGIGFGIASVVDQKDTKDPATTGTGGTGNGPAASPSAGPLGPLGPLLSPTGPLGPLLGPLGPLTGPLGPVLGSLGLFTGGQSSFEERAVTPEYQQWLDDGTGGMGDLVVISR